MKIPNTFKNALNKQDAQEKKERQQEITEERGKNEQRKLFRQNETAKRGEKIELCKKIFAWKDEFLKNEEGARIFKKSGKNLWVYTGNWGHQLPQYGGYGCWARIYFNQKNIEYRAGYKWMGGGPCFTFTKPEEMAKLSYKFLKDFLTEIENKKIFEDILELNTD